MSGEHALEGDSMKSILERAKTGCLQCAIWDEAAKQYGKKGICEKCFNESYVYVNTSYTKDLTNITQD